MKIMPTGWSVTYACNTEVLNGRDFMSCSSTNSISTLLASKCSIMLFSAGRTSEIQLTLFERVQVGEGRLDELSCESHRRGLPIVICTRVLKGVDNTT